MDNESNPLVEAYCFFFSNANDARVTVDKYLQERGEVIRRLRDAVLSNPGYLGLFGSLLLGWASVADYFAVPMAKLINIQPSPESVHASDVGYLARLLAGAFVLLVIWFASRWTIASYENRKKLIAESQVGLKKTGLRHALCVGWKGRSGKSKKWMCLSLISCLILGICTGIYIIVARDEIKQWLFAIVVLGAWIRCVRACSLSIGFYGRVHLFLFPALTAVVLGAIGAGGVLLKPAIFPIELAPLVKEVVIDLIALVILCATTLDFFWFGVAGFSLVVHVFDSARTSKESKTSSEAQLITISDWVLRDSLRWFISGVLLTLILILVDWMGLFLLGGL